MRQRALFGRYLFGLALCGSLLAMPHAGCARGARSDPTFIGAGRAPSVVTGLSVTAKPRDLDAAVARSLPDYGLAVLERTGEFEEGFRNYDLLGIRGQTGVLRAEFEPTQGSLEKKRTPQTIKLSARIGRFGEPPEEKSLLETMRTELRRLARQK